MTHIDLTNERVSIRESVRKRVLLALLITLYHLHFNKNNNDYFIKKLCGVHLKIGVLREPKKKSPMGVPIRYCILNGKDFIIGDGITYLPTLFLILCIFDGVFKGSLLNNDHFLLRILYWRKKKNYILSNMQLYKNSISSE